MNDKINVLDMQIDNPTAKDVMKQAVEYMQDESLSIIKLVTVDMLMQAGEVPGLTQEIEKFDLVLAGEKEILEAAGVTDRRMIQEVDSQLFMKMFMRYLHKNHNRLFLLMESEKEAAGFTEYLERYYPGIMIEGSAVVPADEGSDDMIVNQINGAEVDCVFAMLSSPKQELFAIRNRMLLNARIWLGIGNTVVARIKIGSRGQWLRGLITKSIFKRELEKEKRKKGNIEK